MPSPKPKESNSFSFHVHAIGGLGDGMAEHNGKPVFIPKTCAGDLVTGYITKKNREGFTAQIERIETAGPDRIAPPCTHYASCGGCSLQHIKNDAYTAFKQRVLDNALHHAGFSDVPRTLHRLSPATRRRVEFSLFQGRLALHQLRSHRLTAIEHCLMLRPELQRLLEPVNRVLAQFSEMQTLQTVSLTLADSGVDILTKGVNTPSNKAAQALLEETHAARISHEYRAKFTTLASKAEVMMHIGNARVALPHGAFLQPSVEGQARLTELVLEGVQYATRVVDLFSGIGTFSLPLAEHATVVAFEGNASMVEALKACDVEAHARDLFRHPLSAHELGVFDAAVINPPRAGAFEQVEQIAKSTLKRVVMVSCNPASFARDAKILKNNGYGMIRAEGIDQFVYSAHLEIVAIFEKF